MRYQRGSIVLLGLALNLPTPSLIMGSTSVNAIAPLEQQVYQQVNQYRSRQNLPALRLDPKISEQSRLHSQAMASQGKLSHDGFESRIQILSTTIPYQGAAENVAYNQGYADPVTAAVQGWIKSPGHQQNMLGPFDVTGIGIAQNAKGEYYFTQIFIRTR